jgi:hypothetical protein
MWFSRIKNDISLIPDLVDHYQSELDQAQQETRIQGSLEKNAQDLPGVMSHRFQQLQDLEAVLKWLNTRSDKNRSDHYRRYLERYNRELSDRAIEKYIDGEADIVSMNDLINEVALIRNRYLAVIKGLEAKGYMMGHIVKLRVCGLNDSQL